MQNSSDSYLFYLTYLKNPHDLVNAVEREKPGLRERVQSRSRAWKTSVTIHTSLDKRDIPKKNKQNKQTKKFFPCVVREREGRWRRRQSVRNWCVRCERSAWFVLWVCVLFSLLRWQNLQLLFLSLPSLMVGSTVDTMEKKGGGGEGRAKLIFGLSLFTRTSM